MTTSVTLGANERHEKREVGDFFRLMEAELPVNVTFYRDGKKTKEALGVRAGFAEDFEDGGFDRVDILNGATPNDVQFVVRLGSRIEYDVPPIGQVEVVNTSGAFTQSEPAVTNAAGGVVVLAANPIRRYLLVQNNDALANLRVTLDGSAPTATHGIKLAPDGALEMSNYVPTGQVRVIADQATAAVTVVEG